MASSSYSTRIMDKARFFQKSGFWPVTIDLDPEGWLENFRHEEKGAALAMLDSFLYFAQDLTSQIIRCQFHRLSEEVAPWGRPAAERNRLWREFCQSVVITYPTDERPAATDSGRMYLRKARGALPLQQHQYLDPADALVRLSHDPDIPIVFLDDFAGTGSQFCETWSRRYGTSEGEHSFSDLASPPAFYIPILATDRARSAIGSRAPSVVLRPGHLLGEEYSILTEQSIIWPAGMQDEGIEVVKLASERAGIPLGNGQNPRDWCGFGRLGLCVAMEDTIPDASLPIFYWEENGWRPLKRRP